MSSTGDGPLDVLLLSPYHGGSHAGWAEGLQRHCRHRVRIESLPARFWKWRMHGAAITLARRLARQEQPPDVVLATDMLDVAAFVGLTRGPLGHPGSSGPDGRSGRPGLAVYMHENQVTYPLPAEPGRGPMRRQAGERDRHYGFVNLTSMLAADRVAFNSEYHRRSLLEALPSFLRHFPDAREIDVVERLWKRSEVVPVGIDVVADRPGAMSGETTPLVVWNQRWEYDKNPEETLVALRRLAADGVDFRIALCGERYGRCPAGVEDGVRALGERVIHDGYLEREEYLALLRRADLVVSTAHHEFFGVAVLEAIAHGAVPVLPARLSYPELLPAVLHGTCLYEDHDGLVESLRRAITDPGLRERIRRELVRGIRERFAWERVAPRYDALFERLSGRCAESPEALSAGRRPPAES